MYNLKSTLKISLPKVPDNTIKIISYNSNSWQRKKRQYEQKYNLEQQQLAIARAAAAKSASSSSSTINKTSNSKVKASTSTATVKLSNGKTGYTSATAAYKAIGGGRPLNDKGLLKDGYVMQSTYKGKTYYYAVKK